MNQKELITIIIPTYNSEQFIESCLDSVIQQTYTKKLSAGNDRHQRFFPILILTENYLVE